MLPLRALTFNPQRRCLLAASAAVLLAGLAPLVATADEHQQDEQARETDSATTASWTIPFGGNAYVTGGEMPQRRRGRSRSDLVQSLYFRVDRAADLQIALRAAVPEGQSQVRATVAGQPFTVDLQGDQPTAFPLGRVRIEQEGYVRVDLQGLSKTGAVFAEPIALEVSSATPGLTLAYVKDNEDNRFYWGRRGPSVHLAFTLPEDRSIEWFYSELTVPEGLDPIGSYFMANGFGEGYFGMQVNSPSERRILFSVWSPFATDNPRDIPEDQRIVVLAKGNAVYTGEFGNEGSGGQSYLRFPWKAGTTYRFLNRAKPDGQGNTIYSGWFYALETEQWQLIASFLRPKTDKHLTGIHSFLENFSDRNGWLERLGHYGNQWARDTQGNWISLEQARFTGDDIVRRGYRLDFVGGVVGQQFFLRNGGFFAETVSLGSRFTRPASERPEPAIALEQLEGVTAGLQ